DLTNGIAIQGPGEDNLTVQQAAASFSAAILTVDAGQTASLSGLTITNANHNGIQNSGTLTISGCTLSGNSAAVDVLGGAIDNVRTSPISYCPRSGTSPPPGPFEGPLCAGGAIYNVGTMTVGGCPLSGNTADATAIITFNGGGAIYNLGTMTVSTSS